ncbi:MAG: transporter substrate-binding domain-containing protein [Eubacterium sp.]|nr:transporter substrate-binding domain-containing protein [Eubacterium sp.]
MRKINRKMKLKKVMAFFLIFIFMLSFAEPLTVRAKDNSEEKVVRVGWFDSSFCYYDSFGRRCGIAYEYDQKIAAYTGWTYEYVEDSWPNLLQMLKEGKIDLLSDVSYKPEREDYILYPDLPMGTEAYYIYISADNREISADDLDSFNGKKIGVNSGSVQATFLEEWADKNGIKIETVAVNVDEAESMSMLESGEIDGYATILTYDTKFEVLPVARIGGSDYYYAVNKNRPDLLADLNMALSQIQDEDPYYNQKISEDRLYNTKTNTILTPDQEDWIKEHGTIRIGYRDNYLPFCAQDQSTGELTGALKDYLAHVQNKLSGVDISFETIPYSSTKEEIEALKAGDVDCIFPVYLSTYDANERDIRLTAPAMKTEMYAILRSSEKHVLSEKSEITFAVNEGMMNIESFIMENYPLCKRQEYEGLDSCYKAVADGNADFVLVSNYRIPSSEEKLKKLKLVSVPTGESLQFSFAVNKWDTDLYFILNKTALTTKNEDVDTSLASYMLSDQKVSFMQFLEDNWFVVIVILILVFSSVIFLLVRNLKAERLALKQKSLLEEAEEIAELKQTVTSLLDNMPGMNYTKDAETGKYLACNQEFADYAHKKSPEEVIGLTAYEIFDKEAADHFVEDDNIALSMDEPYIFYEDLTDSAGEHRQIRTTKLKYTDANGRLCVLGISVDITDTVRINRGSVKNKESYEKARNTGVVFIHMASTLAQGYKNLYYIDLNSEEFIEYMIDDEGFLVEARRGWHFFELCQENIQDMIYPEDREALSKALERHTLEETLDHNNNFMMTYREIYEGKPTYVSMKISRMRDDNRYMIMGITNVDDQMKEHNAAAQMKEEQVAYNRISALAGDFFCIYIVVPETGQYREFNASGDFDLFEHHGEGLDFFTDARERTVLNIYPEDQNRFLSALTRENVLAEVEQSGIFTLSCRMIIDGEPRYVQFKAALVEEKEGSRLIIGVNDIDSQVRQEEEYGRRLAQARIEANIDALTGVKNRNAYRVYEERLNAQIEMNRAPDFAITILDLNDLKKINDTEGHKAGDQYLRDACKIICTTFKRSPVFRVGGDEFAVLSQGDDYKRLDELIDMMNAHNEEAVNQGGIVIALGMSRYDHDTKVATVYERADQLMYENKSALKARKK